MQIEIKSEDIEKMVREELIKAGIGKVIVEGVHKALTGYNNPVDTAIKLYVGEVAAKVIREHYAAQIDEAIVKTIREMMTPELIDKVTDATVKKMVRAAADTY